VETKPLAGFVKNTSKSGRLMLLKAAYTNQRLSHCLFTKSTKRWIGLSQSGLSIRIAMHSFTDVF
jgi:hypothetical protein